MSGLVEDWEQIVDNYMDLVQTMPDYATRTFGWNLGDELLGEGVPLANVTAVAQRIRARFGPKTFIYWNETPMAFTPGPNGTQPCTGAARCAATTDPAGCCLNQAGGVPAVFDAVSIDMYAGTLQRNGLPDPNSTCSNPTHEADCVFAYMRRYVYPHISASQRVFVVPGSAFTIATEDNFISEQTLIVHISRCVACSIREPAGRSN